VVERVDAQSGGKGRTEVRVHGKVWRGNAVASSSKLPQPHVVPSATVVQAMKQELPPSTPGMKYRHYSPRVPVYLLLPSNTFPRPSSPSSLADCSPSDVLRPIIAAVRGSKRPRIGLMHYENSPLSRSLLDPEIGGKEGAEIFSISLGSDATSAARRLFSGMLALEGKRLSAGSENGHAPGEESENVEVDVVDVDQGVDAILVEGCSDEGLGLAVMERVGKAVGGGGKTGELGNGQGEGAQGRFWVQV